MTRTNKPQLPQEAAAMDEPALPRDVESAMYNSLDSTALSPERNRAIKSRLMQRVRQQRRNLLSDQCLSTLPAAEGEWRPFLPKVSIRHLQRVGDSLTYLLKLEPGAILVPHDHPQDEECIVLSGEVRIGETVARTGDYHFAPKGVAHGAIVSDTGALLFLRGAVPAANQVHWASLGTLAAFSPEPVRQFIRRHWEH
ncbi:MAG: hypothetical protein RIR00_2100 [Pseudomonadota bacterium]|jgi:anti-sigma factor ChrR (cupin superfamily)